MISPTDKKSVQDKCDLIKKLKNLDLNIISKISEFISAECCVKDPVNKCKNCDLVLCQTCSDAKCVLCNSFFCESCFCSYKNCGYCNETLCLTCQTYQCDSCEVDGYCKNCVEFFSDDTIGADVTICNCCRDDHAYRFVD